MRYRFFRLTVLGALVACSGGGTEPDAGPRVEIAAPAGGAQAGAPFAQQPVVRIVDAAGNLLLSSSGPVTVTVAGGAAIVGAPTATPINGVATFSGVGLAGAPGDYALTYSTTVNGATHSVSQTITLSVGAATGLVVQTPAAGAAGGYAFTTQPVVRVTDPAGNTATGFSGIVTITPGAGAAIAGSATAQAVAGIATFTHTGLNAAAGTYALTYSATVGGAVQTAAQAIQVSPGSPAGYVVTPSVSQAEVGSTVTFAAQLVDANGAAVPRAGQTVTWARSGAQGSFSAAETTTDNAGIARVTLVLDTAFTSGTMGVVAADKDNWQGVITLLVVRGPPAKLVFVQQPPNAEWKIGFATSVALKDRYGNTISDAVTPITMSVASSPGGASLGGDVTVNTFNGVATFPNLFLDEAGTGYTLRGSSGSLSPATSQPFNVSAIGVVARSPTGLVWLNSDSLLGLVVARDGVYWASRYLDAAINLAAWKAPMNGGAATYLRTVNNYRGGGRTVDDGNYVDVLHWRGTANGSGALLRLLIAGDGWSEMTLGLLGQITGPDLETDGTYVYHNYASSIPNGTAPGSPSRLKGGIRRVDLLSEVRTQLVEREIPEYAPMFSHAGGFVYYPDSGSAGITLQKIPASGGTSTTIATGLGDVSGSTYGELGWRRMLVVGNTVYWVEVNSGSGSIRSVSTSGGTPTTRVSGLSSTVRNLNSDGTYLYVNDGGSIKRFTLSTFSATTLVANDDVADIALSGDAIFWLSNGATKEVKKTRR